MANQAQDLTQGSIRVHLVRMTIPMFLGISSMIVASMMDTVYIGLLGADELAAISFTFPLIMALTSVSMGIGNGAASVIARAEGAGDRERVRRLSTHATLLTIILVLLLMVVGLAWQDRLFDIMGAQPGILPLVVQYMDVWILGLIFFTLPMVGSTILRSVGNARLPGYIMTTSSLIQIVLAPLLIFGLLGFPEWGFVGSAWSFIFCGVWRTVGMFWVSIRHERLLLFGAGALDGMWSSTRTILYIGFPSMLNSLIGPVSMGTIIWLLAQHGPEVVAGFGIASRFEMLVMMVLMSLSSSIGPFVGQNWGARRLSRVYDGLAASYKFSIFWGILCFAFLAPFGDDLVALINDEPVLVESAGWFLLLVPLSFGALGIGMMSGSTFVALGRPIPTTVLALLRMIVIYIPLALLFNLFWGYIGIFLATTIANFIMAGLAFYWSRSTLARERRWLERAPETA